MIIAKGTVALTVATVWIASTSTMAAGRTETAAPYVQGNRSGILQSTHTQRGAAGRICLSSIYISLAWQALLQAFRISALNEGTIVEHALNNTVPTEIRVSRFLTLLFVKSEAKQSCRVRKAYELDQAG